MDGSLHISPPGCINYLFSLLHRHVSSDGEGVGEKMVMTYVILNVPNKSTNCWYKVYTVTHHGARCTELNHVLIFKITTSTLIMDPLA